MNHDNSSLSESPFGKQKRDWVMLYRVLIVIFSLFSMGGITMLVYSGASFVRAEASEQVHVELVPFEKRVQDRVAPLETLPSRVQRLEDFRVDQRRLQEQTTTAVSLIQQDLAAIRAISTSQADEARRTSERILKQLDRLMENAR